MIRLYNQDCLDAMREMRDNEFDLAIVDPPYGIKRSGQKESICKNPKHNRKYFEDKGWDTHRPSKEYFDHLFRVSKNQIIWGANYYPEYLSSSKGWIVWDKGQKGLTMSDCELAFSSFSCPTRIYVCNRCELAIEGTIHPTQKPIKLYLWLMQKYAQPGDKILDTHLGSGSSALAAHDLGFDFVGYELDTEYYEAAQERLRQHQRQLSLFEDAVC
jgi:site-specific DNA-methyltransferase (adenine-specific)